MLKNFFDTDIRSEFNQIRNSTSASSSSSTSPSNGFPTSLLKNILENSDLLEVLLKPIEGNDNEINEIKELKNDVLANLEPKANLDENTWSMDSSSKVYGNAFLGPNLWNKSDLFDGNKLGDIQLEYLDIEDFLNENGLNNDAHNELLNELNSPNKKNLQKSNTYQSTNDSADENYKRSSSIRSRQSISELSIDINDDTDKSFISFSSMNSPKEGNSRLKITGSIMDLNINDIETNENKLNYADMNFNSKIKKFTEDELRPQPIIKKSKKFHEDEEDKMNYFGSSSHEIIDDKHYVPNELKDEKYWARRRKNNVAAKRSRDARRVKENQIALRAAFLERENESLKKQLDDYKRETKTLKTKLARYEAEYSDKH